MHTGPIVTGLTELMSHRRLPETLVYFIIADFHIIVTFYHAKLDAKKNLATCNQMFSPAMVPEI